MQQLKERPAFHEKLPILHEMYGRYFLITAELLKQAQESGQLTFDDIYKTAEEMGYSETALKLPYILTQEEEDGHALFQGDGVAFKAIVKPVTRPLSLLERRWLATILRDPKIGLFMDDDEIAQVSKLIRDSKGSNAEPLFNEEDYIRFGVGHDSDDYYDADFRKVFRTILSALRGKSVIGIEYTGYSGKQRCKQVMPLKIEYSMKYDLFRLIYKESKNGRDVILPIRIRRIERASVSSCEAIKDESPDMEKVFVSVSNENSSLERAHIRFANYKVSVKSVEQDKRILHISYPHYEEDELIEVILSFGPAAQVVDPEHVVDKIRAKLSRQGVILR